MTDTVVPMVDGRHKVSIDTVLTLLEHEKGRMEAEKFRAFKLRSQAQDVTAEEALGHMADIRAIHAVFGRMKQRLTQAKMTEQQAIEEKNDG